MASKRRLRRSQCGDKRAYDSADEAHKGAGVIAQRDGGRSHMNVYHCSFCGHWHLGHATSHPKGGVRGGLKASRQRRVSRRHLAYRSFG